jgi:glycosyltransferase involved in cell wall biosynthesis
MKIVVVGTRGFPGVQGGVENHCEQLYTHLAKKGCDIIVFTRKAYVSSDIHSYKGISLIPLSCPKNKFLEAFVHTFKGVVKAKRLKPEIVHIHAIGPSFFVPLAKLMGMKVVFTHHGPDYERKKWTLPAKIFLKYCERIGVKFADAVITVAKNISDDIRDKYGRESTVIPNGVEIPANASTDYALKMFGLLKRKYILTVGRLVPEKGFHDLIDAYIRNDFGEWKLVIVGDADHEDKYSRSMKATALKNKDIVLTGFLTGQPLHELYSHAGIFVLPSYYEGLPIVLLEAMSHGLSCLASDIPANRNVALSEDRFFKVGNTGLLSAKIKNYIEKPWGEEEKKKQINLIAEKYNWEKIAIETLKVYNL